MEIEVWVTCYSQKTDVSISCVICIESADGSIDIANAKIIYEALSESFWENCQDFEDSIAQAEAKQKSDSTLSFEQALLSVFGHFSISFAIDGKEIDLDIDANADDFMYSLLQDIKPKKECILPE